MTQAIIVDIDGTLADNLERMHAVTRKRAARLGITVEDLQAQHVPWTDEDWRTFYNGLIHDKPIIPMCRAVRGLRIAGGYGLLFVTGRMEACRKYTEAWLATHVYPQHRFWNPPLYMRPDGDHRPDYVLKEEILDKHILPRGWEPVMAFEDRPQVAEMWRRRGILVAQIGGAKP